MFQTFLGISIGGAIFAALILLTRRLLKGRWNYHAFSILWLCLLFFLLIPQGFQLPGIGLNLQIPLDRYDISFNLDTLTYTITDTAEEAEESPLARFNYFHYDESEDIVVHLRFSQALVALWIAGMVVYLAYQMIRGRSFARKCRKLPYLPASGDLLDLLQAAKREYRLKRKIELRVVKDIPCPISRGFFRPVIYMPHDIVYPDALYLIICHEIVAIRRWTPFFKALGYLAVAVHWFNPLAHLARRCWLIDSKLAADGRVLAKETPRMRETYIAALEGVNSDHEIGDFFYVSKKAAETRKNHILTARKRTPGFVLLLIGLPLLLLSLTFFQVSFHDAARGSWKSVENLNVTGANPAVAAEALIAAAGDSATEADVRALGKFAYEDDGKTALGLYSLGGDVHWLIELRQEGELWRPSRYQVLQGSAASRVRADLAFGALMTGFTYPDDAKSAANAWAKAWSEGNGAVQFSLLSEEYQKMLSTYFASLYWHTAEEGVTVASYQLKTGGLSRITGYEIIFKRTAAAGETLPDSGYFLGLEQGSEEAQSQWRITEVNNIYNSVEGEQVLVPAYPLLAAMKDAAALSGLTPPEIGKSEKRSDENGNVTYLLTSQIEIYTDSPPVYVLSEMKDKETKTWSYQIYPKYYRVLSVPE